MAEALRKNLDGIVVYKMTGSGNDFVLLDGRDHPPASWPRSATRLLCDRRTGVGGDGLVLVSPGSGPDRIRMSYFNRDGSVGDLCGNAALCSIRFARTIEMLGADQAVLETKAGDFEVRLVHRDRAELGIGDVPAPVPLEAKDLLEGENRGALTSVGVPHMVVLVEQLDELDVLTRGRALRSCRAVAPHGANVNFVAPGPRGGTWSMRTYERGVEDETLACGTGAVAATAALSAWGLAEPPTQLITRSGRTLSVRGTRGRDGLSDIWLSGEARVLFRAALMDLTKPATL